MVRWLTSKASSRALTTRKFLFPSTSWYIFRNSEKSWLGIGQDQEGLMVGALKLRETPCSRNSQNETEEIERLDEMSRD